MTLAIYGMRELRGMARLGKCTVDGAWKAKELVFEKE
jgi:hypothetical protein